MANYLKPEAGFKGFRWPNGLRAEAGLKNERWPYDLRAEAGFKCRRSHSVCRHLRASSGVAVETAGFVQLLGFRCVVFCPFYF